MSTDLARQEAQAITDPATGEVITRADTEKVADLYRRIKEVQGQWSEAAVWCVRALLDAADERSEWGKRRIGDVELTIDPPAASSIQWDYEELHKLEELLPADRYGELVVQTVSEKAETKKLQTLAKQAGEGSPIAEIITRAERRVPRARAVKVER
jgi:hypothetical protein